MKYRWKIVQREESIFLSIKVYTFQERQTLGEIEEARANKKLVRTHIYTYIHTYIQYIEILGVTLTLNEIDLSRRSRIEIYFASREICRF